MEQKEYFFEKLTPNDEVDISVYDEAMEFVFDNSDITNIAISGAYGAGKSSVIDSYKKKHTDKKFMHISLAHFESSDIKDETDVIDETMIEGKILNQLIHQIPVSKIPQTNFRVKKEISKLHIFKIAVLFYLMIGSLVFISFSGKIQSFVKSLSKSNLKNVLGFITDKNAVIFAVGVLIVSVFICVYNIVKIQEYKKLFHKVTVQGNSIEKVLSSSILRIVDFYEEETLNFDLLNGLLGNLQNSRYQKYLSVLIKQMKDKKCLNFISKFYDSSQFDIQFIVKLNELWPDFFSYVKHNKGLPSEQIRRFSLDTIILSDEETIQGVNIDNCLANYISSQGDYLNVQKPDIEKLISGFIFLDIKFKTIAYNKANMELFTRVYENDLYELTFENIIWVIVSEYGENNLYNIEHRNYTIIQTEPKSPLALYVATDMNTYVNEILKNCGGVIEDSEKYAIELINNSSVSDEGREKYVECLTTVISDISSIKNRILWASILSGGIVQKTVSNIIYYYEEYSLSKELIKFINECDVDMDYSLVEKDFGNEIARKFFDVVANNDDIDIEKYENILCSMGYIFDSYETDKISDDRMDILIKNNIIEMNEAGLEYIRSYYSNHILMYIDYNIEKYLDIISSANFDYKEMLHVLDMDIEDVKKVLLLKLTREPVSIIGKNYSDYIMAYIIENNFDIHDENELCNHFSKYNEIIQQAICAVAASRIDNVILDSSIVLDDILLSKLLQNRNCSTDDRISLWAKVLPGLDEETCKKHFDELGFPELKNIFTKRNSFTRVYDKNSYTTHIFAELKKNGWIYDYREKEDDSEKYIVIKYLTRTRR